MVKYKPIMIEQCSQVRACWSRSEFTHAAASCAPRRSVTARLSCDHVVLGCGDEMVSRYSVATGKPSRLISNSNWRAWRKPLLIWQLPSRSGSLICTAQCFVRQQPNARDTHAHTRQHRCCCGQRFSAGHRTHQTHPAGGGRCCL